MKEVMMALKTIIEREKGKEHSVETVDESKEDTKADKNPKKPENMNEGERETLTGAQKKLRPRKTSL